MNNEAGTRKRPKGIFGIAGLPAVLCALLFVACGTAEAANLMVSYAGDDGRAGSLRSTIAAAADGDRIIFHSSVTTVSLTDYLFVNKALTIEGPVTIKQTKPGARVLYVTGACTLKNLTITGGSLATGSGTYGAGVYCYADLTMTNCTVTGNTGGGGIQNLKNLVLQGCTISGNSANGSNKAGGIGNSAFGSWNVSLTMTDCVVENNTCVNGNTGGIYNGVKATLTMARTTIRNNGNSGLGGGMYLSTYATTTLTDHCAVYGNSPDNICCAYDATYSADGTCTIGSAPNKSATAFSGYSGEKEPEPRSIVGDSDVAAVKSALANPQSALYGVIEHALAADLGKTVEGKSTSLAPLAGMAATLYAANTFEDVSLTSADLSVEYTASWPSNVRYYALFDRADGSGYELADRGVQFEIKAGQSLPDGVTPPDFYVPGEGLMTWKNIVTDNGSYDLNPGVGEVTIRVCSVRAAEVVGDKGSGGGCNAGAGFAPTALLFALPLCAFVRSKGSVRK